MTKFGAEMAPTTGKSWVSCRSSRSSTTKTHINWARLLEVMHSTECPSGYYYYSFKLEDLESCNRLVSAFVECMWHCCSRWPRMWHVRWTESVSYRSVLLIYSNRKMIFLNYSINDLKTYKKYNIYIAALSKMQTFGRCANSAMLLADTEQICWLPLVHQECRHFSETVSFMCIICLSMQA